MAGKRKHWTVQELRLLGTKPDAEVARLTGRSYGRIWAKRNELKITPCLRFRRWTPREDEVVLSHQVSEAAKLLGRTVTAVCIRYRKLEGRAPGAWHEDLLDESEVPEKVTAPRYESNAEEERLRLVGGPYGPPRVSRGGFLRCKLRGRLRVGGYTNAPIPWPVSWQHPGQLIICGDLLKALRTESRVAVCYHFGLSPQTASDLRRLLGVERYNPGSMRLFWRNVNLAGTDEARAKLSKAKEGRPSTESAEDREKLRLIQRRPKSKRWRERMRQFWKKRFDQLGRPRPWTKKELHLLGTRPDREVARMVDRSLASVRAMKFRIRKQPLSPAG